VAINSSTKVMKDRFRASKPTMPNFYQDKLDEQNQKDAEEIISVDHDHD
jgi:hypothetical protein